MEPSPNYGRLAANRNGHRNGKGKIRVAIIGVGNCASSLVQGIEFYRNAPEGESVPGLVHVNPPISHELVGGHDTRFSAASALDIPA